MSTSSSSYLASCNKSRFITFFVFPLVFSGVIVWRTQFIKLSNQCVYIVLNLPSLSVLMHVSDACINAEPCLVPSKIFFFSVLRFLHKKLISIKAWRKMWSQSLRVPKKEINKNL